MNKSRHDISSLLGIDYPIIQGPFGGGLSTSKLVSTVSNNGGLGSYGAHLLSPESIIELGDEIRISTKRSFALNLWVSKSDPEADDITQEQYELCCENLSRAFGSLKMPIPLWKDRPQEFTFEEQAMAVIKAKPKALSFVYGVPSDEILLECKRKGIVTIGAATTIEEAILHENAGVDMVVVSGFEAGGHRPSFLKSAEDSLVGTFSLIPTVRDKVKLPIISAGGVADSRGIHAAMALGADAVQVGTAFLACKESGAPSIHRQLILENQTEYGVLSRAYTGRLARFLENDVTRHYLNNPSILLPFPLQSWLVSATKKEALLSRNRQILGAYSGQSSPIVRLESAKDLMKELSIPFLKKGAR